MKRWGRACEWWTMCSDRMVRGKALRQSLLAVAAGGFLLAGCVKDAGPEDVALEYTRALYAGDLAGAYRLISTEDRRVKDERTFLRDGGAAEGVALEMARKLASFIVATPVKKTSSGERLKVRLGLKLPNANAPEIAGLVHDWDERRLNALSDTERRQITQQLTQLHRAGQIPMLEGEETFELVREGSGWRVFLNWAGGVRVRFGATTDTALPLRVTVAPEEVRVTPGERVSVTVRAQNPTTRDVVVRVGHRVEPKLHADSLALVHCPLFLPVTLKPGETEEFRSEYVLLKDVPDSAKQFQVTYEFSPTTPAAGSGGTSR